MSDRPQSEEMFFPLIERIERLEQERQSTRASIVTLLAAEDQQRLVIRDPENQDLLLTSCVYFVAAEAFGRVKIGFSTNLPKRLHSLQTSSGCPLTLLGAIDGTVADERYWHSLLTSKRVHGEWFIYDDEMRTIIKGVLERRVPNEEVEALQTEMICLGEDIEDVFIEMRHLGYQPNAVRAILQSRLKARLKSEARPALEVCAAPEARA